ncbi:hypothetical protein OF83DRAFT_1177421 [Amylostereum chailletii]|nr:hypothetical protein OF83DRAFT_1177421 [Amylostereum chailletii]
MLLSSQSSFLGFFFLSSVCHGVAGQSFTIPSTWQNTTSSLSRTDRAQIARDAIGQLAPLIDSATGTIDSALTTLNATASLFASFALNDWITGDTTYKSIVVSNVPTFLGLQPDLGVASDSAIWGLTAYYTFRAYNDSSFLHTATNAWDYASRHLITDAQVGAGSHPTRDFELPTQCNGSSVAGGVFSTEDSSDGAVNGETVGPFLALSAYLAEATSNSTYSSAAELSAAFIRDHLFNGTVVSYDFDVKACQVSAADFVFTHDSGFAIEGYSPYIHFQVLSNSLHSAESLVATSVPFPAWTNPDGVIAEDDKTKLSKVKNGFKRIFVRALHEVWLRSDPDSDIAKFIASFLTIQFNSIQANAKIPGSNAYSPFWDGPAFEKLHAVSQVIALYALNSAIDIVQPASNGTASGR